MGKTIGDPVTCLDLKSLGSLLRCARTNLRRSCRELARESGVSASQILRMESGEHEYSIVSLHRLCETLGLPVSEVVEFGIKEIWTMPAFRIEAEEDIQKLCDLARKRGESEDVVSRRAKVFIEYAFRIAARILLLSVTSAVRAHSDNTDPSVARHDASEELVVSLYGMSNLQRREAVKDLFRSPYLKLKSLGFVSLSILDSVTATDHAWTVKPILPPTIEATLEVWKVETVDRQLSIDEIAARRVDQTVPGFKNDIKYLMARLDRLTRERGSKSALARTMGVSRQAVDNWIRGKTKPKVEIWLRLLEWVQAEEANQQKGPAGGETPAEPRTRTRNLSNETKSPPNPAKR